MENSIKTKQIEKSLQVVAIAYHIIMLAAFVVGLYGFFSLFWLASAEVHHSVILNAPPSKAISLK